MQSMVSQIGHNLATKQQQHQIYGCAHVPFPSSRQEAEASHDQVNSLDLGIALPLCNMWQRKACRNYWEGHVRTCVPQSLHRAGLWLFIPGPCYPSLMTLPPTTCTSWPCRCQRILHARRRQGLSHEARNLILPTWFSKTDAGRQVEVVFSITMQLPFSPFSVRINLM